MCRYEVSFMLKMPVNNPLSKAMRDPDIKMILTIFAPVFVDMILNHLISTIHSWLVAGAGEAAISGIGLVGTINSILMVLFISLPSASTIIVSQHNGAGNLSSARRCVSHTVILVAFLASVVMAIILLFPNQLFDLFFDGAEPDVLSEAKKYMIFSAVSLPFYGIFQSYAMLCRGFGNNKVPLYTSVSGSVVNVITAFICIKALGLGVVGAGIGLVVSRVYMVIVGSVFFVKNRWFATREEFPTVEWKSMGAILKIGLLSNSESLIVNIGGTLKMRFIVAAGTSHIAANSIHGTFFALVFVPVSALSVVAITLVGKYIGAGEKEEAKNIIKKMVLVCCTIYGALLVVALFLFPQLYPLYTENPETLRLLRTMLYISVPMLCITNPFVSIVNNAFKSAGDAFTCTLTSVICMWTVNVGLGIFLAADFGLGLGVIGSLIGGNASACVKAAIYFFRYRSGKWIKKKLV